MGKKISSALTYPPWPAALCYFTLSHLLHPKLDVLPNSLNTVNAITSQLCIDTAQTRKVLDITMCLRAFREYSRVAQALSQVSHLEGFCLEGTEFVSLIAIWHVEVQTIGAETISPRDSIQVKKDSWAPCSFWGYNLKGCGGKEKIPNSESTILGAVTQLTLSQHPTKRFCWWWLRSTSANFSAFIWPERRCQGQIDKISLNFPP